MNSRRSKGKSRDKQQGGQILILMALLTTTLIIMFGMVVAVGHLVQARINLQNSVDLASMVGASFQARYLNHIALINYRFRQNYKFTLYDLYVTQSRFNGGFNEVVKGGGGMGKVPKDKFIFGVCQQSYGFDPNIGGVSQGEKIQDDTDLCQKATGSGGMGKSIPAIQPYTGPLISPELIAINETIIQLKQNQKDLCEMAGNENRDYVKYFLERMGGRQQFQMSQIMSAIAQFGQGFGTGSGNDARLDDHYTADAAMIATFKSNLISALRDGDGTTGVKLEYINPPETRSPNGVNTNSADQALNGTTAGSFGNYFESSTARFTVPWVKFTFSESKGCTAELKTVSNTSEFFVGLGRARVGGSGSPVKIPFGIALRATIENPRLLFWPRSLTPTLSAVAAARPFGSRIGPPKDQTDREIGGSGSGANGNLANMSFFPGDLQDDSGMHGIGHIAVLSELAQRLKPLGAWPPGISAGRNVRRPGPPSGDCSSGAEFACLALAPTLYESLFWNAYMYPRNNYATRPLQEAFPGELSITPVDGSYALPDRQAGASSSWVNTVNISVGAVGGKPVFFGDNRAILSSWTPAINPGSFPSDWPADGAGVGRVGYQIKLASIYEFCRDISTGNSGGSGVDLRDLKFYCNSPSGSTPTAGSVFH